VSMTVKSSSPRKFAGKTSRPWLFTTKGFTVGPPGFRKKGIPPA
jgi:hypothetical protein